MTIFTVQDIDIVYLSYDEPNCESNWSHLQTLCPRAQRVHGVKGSDAAHKACAALATGTHVITVDGDNQIRPEFLELEWLFDSSWDLEHSVLSFPARNAVNGLCYGNGGIKIWPRRVIEEMQTHEQANDGQGVGGVDFCWALDYVLMPGVWSDVLINHTEHQAWRAGFREGVKLSLVDGHRIQAGDQWHQRQAKNNMDRLLTWLQVGLDQRHGFYAILGARQGLFKTMLTTWDHTRVQDFDHLDAIWEREVERMTMPQLRLLMQDLGLELRNRLNLAVAAEPLSAAQSAWFKTVFKQPVRTEPRRLKG